MMDRRGGGRASLLCCWILLGYLLNLSCSASVYPYERNASTPATTTESERTENVTLRFQYEFGDLQQVVELTHNKKINAIKEDRYSPGSFYVITGFEILKFTPGSPPTRFLGNPTQISSGYREGNSSVAEFSLIADLVQYNRTKYAIVDFLNNCVREYDSETDEVSTLIGQCNASVADYHMLRTGEAVPATDHILGGPIQIALVEAENYFILNGFTEQQIYKYDVESKTVKLFFDDNQAIHKLSNSQALILNPDQTFIYVTHTYGISKVNLQTQQVTLLVGRSTPTSYAVEKIPVSGGSFNETTLGLLSSLAWLAPDNTLVSFSIDNEEALVVIDLTERVVTKMCEGSSDDNATVTGPQNACKINHPTAITVSTEGTIYIATAQTAEAPLHTDSLLFEIKTEIAPLEPEVRFISTCPHCLARISLGVLEEVERDIGQFRSQPINQIKEDLYNPGTFYYTAGYTIMKFTPGQPVELFIGNPSQNALRYTPGNSTTAEFALISDFVQYSRTKMLIADYLNNCVREYDLETDNVIQLAGKCTGTIMESHFLLPGDVVPADTHFLSGVTAMTLIRSGNYLLMIDFGYRVITKYDFVSTNVTLLGNYIEETHLPNPQGMIANEQETELYVAHSYGLSRIILATMEIELLVGKVERGEGDEKLPFSEGPFKNAQLGSVESLRWVIPDELLVTITSNPSEALLFFDMRGKEVFATCNGTVQLNLTIPGPPGTCELNSPTAITVASDGTIYVATLTDEPYETYSFSSASSIYKMETKLSFCLAESPTGNEILKPNYDTFFQYEYITTTCPPGMALNASSPSHRRQCSSNSTWNEPLPSCMRITSAEDIEQISPLSGQLSGGTLVTVVGLIPDSGLQVYTNHSVFGVIPLSFKSEVRQLTFRLPEQASLGFVELIIKLSANITVTYQYEYLENPAVTDVVSYTTTVSGEFSVVFQLTHRDSSSDYTLKINNTLERACEKGENNLLYCNTKFLSDIGSAHDPVSLPMKLFSDGVLVMDSETQHLIVYPDPQFNNTPISLNTGEVMELQGYNLDVGVLNDEYEISIKLSRKKTVVCEVQNVTSSVISCLPKLNGLRPDLSPKDIMIRLGNLTIHPSQAVFVPITEHHPSTASTLTAEATGGIAAVAVIVVIVTIIIIVVIIIKRRRESMERAEMRLNSLRFIKENDDWFVHINVDLKAKLDPLLVKPDSLKLKEGAPIGEGNFGKIFLGQLYHGDVVKTVAVKTLKELEMSITEIEKFLEEAVILQDLNHANVLPTLGVCIPESDTPHVILPYMANGDLKSLLQRENMEFTIGDLMHFAKQVCCGMEYLASNRFVHRDLAARNCLVSDKYIVKIADFGLSRDVYNRDYYRRDEKSGVALPIKWLSLESLQLGVFTTESDVWAFGVLMWELCTRGSQPYNDVDVWDTRTYLEQGRRLPRPGYAPPAVWEVMSGCWLGNPKERPTFSEIYEILDKLLEGTECNPQSSYSYIRDYTKDIPHNYIDQPIEVEMEIGDYLIPVTTKGRQMNHYPPLPGSQAHLIP